MHFRILVCVVQVTLLACAARAQYPLINLGAPGAGTSSIGHRINSRGDIIVSTNNESMFWIRSPEGTYTPAGVPDGYTRSRLSDINDSGFTVGSASIGTTSNAVTRAIIRSPSGDFTFPMPDSQGTASSINALGDVVGHDTSFGRGFFYRPGSPITIIPRPPGTSGAKPMAINNAGMVMGSTGVSVGGPVGIIRGFRWTLSGGSVLMPTIGQEPADVADMNEAGVVVGAIGGQGTAVRAAKWLADNTIVELVAPVATGFIVANAINNRGDVVGSSFHAGPRAVFWSDDIGAVDLNDLLTPDQRFHWTLRNAYDINDHRQIVGQGQFDPDGIAGPEPPVVRAFLLTVPEPGAASICIVTLVALLLRRRARITSSCP